MRRVFSSRLVYLFLLLWLAGTVMLLFIATTSLLRDPQLPVTIGLLRVHGGIGVFAVLLPAACGLAALVRTLQRRSMAAVLLLAYSLFWLVILMGGLVGGVLHAGVLGMERTSFRTWVVGGTTFTVMLASFTLLAVWSIQQLAGHASDDTVS